MKFLVGCPVSGRNWILPTWLQHTLAAFDGRTQPEFLFIVPESDQETLDLLESWKERVTVHIVTVDDTPREEDQDRHWNRPRYEQMVELRNILLQEVRKLQPEFFLSLDSDILLHPDAVISALQTMQRTQADAVGLKCYLSVSGKLHPNAGLWNDKQKDRYYRYDQDRPYEVDILMAIKLMTPRAYNVDYTYHRHGEDLGWSAEANKKGLLFVWDGTYCNKHVMNKDMLHSVDRRVGW
jgi:hypothetical protein